MKIFAPYFWVSLGCFLLLAAQGFSQRAMGFAEAERHSKYLFLEEDYTGLVAFGDTALAAGQDYFALRYRLGAANFQLTRYGVAAKHFAKAHAMNSGEVETMEYLYFSLLYSGQSQAAQLLIRDLPLALREKLQLKKRALLAGINLELGTKLSNDTNAVGNMRYATFNFSHQFTPRLQWVHGLSIVNQRLKFGEYQQLQYYAAPRYYLGKGLSIHGAWHYVHLGGTRLFYPWMLDPRPPMPVGGWRTGTFSSNGNLAHLGISYQRAYLQLRAYGNVTYFHNIEELGPPRVNYDSISDFAATQAGLGVDVTPPLFKRRMMLSATLSMHNLQGNTTILYTQSLGFALTKRIYLEGRFMKCGTAYFNELDGTLLNNTSDPMQVRYTGLANFVIGKHLGAYVMYQNETKTSTSLNQDYHYSNIITGLNIKL